MRFSATSILALAGLLVTPVLSAPIHVHGGSNSITSPPVPAGLEKGSPTSWGQDHYHNPATIVERSTTEDFFAKGLVKIGAKPPNSGPKLAKRMNVRDSVQHPVAGVVGAAPNTIVKRDTGDGFSLNGVPRLVKQILKPAKPAEIAKSGPKLAKRMNVRDSVQHPVAVVVGAAPNTIVKRQATGDGFSLRGSGVSKLVKQILKPAKPAEIAKSGPKLAKRSPMSWSQGTHHNPTTIVERDVLEYGDLVRRQDARGGPKTGN